MLKFVQHDGALFAPTLDDLVLTVDRRETAFGEITSSQTFELDAPVEDAFVWLILDGAPLAGGKIAVFAEEGDPSPDPTEAELAAIKSAHMLALMEGTAS